jgi:acyl-CoA thioester hydrolase
MMKVRFGQGDCTMEDQASDNGDPRLRPSADCAVSDRRNGCAVTLAQLAVLPLYHREIIPDEYIDPMGHMNVRWYMALFDEGTWRFFEDLGLSPEYFQTAHAGGFALRHFISYWSEVRVGQWVAVRTRLLGRTAKRFHFMHFLINESSGQAAAGLESLVTHADLKARRSSPLPEEITERMDTHLARNGRLDWPAPVCGAIALK